MAKKPARLPVDDTRAGQVQSVTRAFAILRAVAESGDGMTLTDIAQIVGLPPSTAHRLLTTLQQERFVRFDGTAHLWQVGVEAFIIGNAFVRTREVVAMARPYLRRLMEEGGETANLYLEQDGEAICMAQVECRQMMRAIARPGGRVKMHCSGAGKAMLGWMARGRAHADRPQPWPEALHRAHPGHARAGCAATSSWCASGAMRSTTRSMRSGCAASPPPCSTSMASPSPPSRCRGPGARVDETRLAELGALTARIAGEFSAELGGHSAARPAFPQPTDA